MFVTPKAGTQVPDIDRGGFLSPAGREVDPTPYWNRLVQVGDVVLATPPVVVPPAGAALKAGDLLIGQRAGFQMLFEPQVSGGGGSGGATSIPFSTALNFRGDYDMGITSVAGAIAMTADVSGAIAGKGTRVTFVGNAANVPAMPSGAAESASSFGYDNTVAGYRNWLDIWWDGVGVVYQWSQPTTQTVVTPPVGDTTPPTISSVSVNGATMVVTYSEALAATPTASAFTVRNAGGAATQAPTAASQSGAVVTLTLGTPAVFGNTVTLDVAAGAASDTASPPNASAAVSARAVTNNTPASDTTPPTIGTAAVNGASLVVTYSEALAAAPSASAYTVRDAGGAATQTPTAVALSGAAVTLTLGTPAVSGNTVTLDVAAGAVADTATPPNSSAAVTGQAVTNSTSSGDDFADWQARMTAAGGSASQTELDAVQAFINSAKNGATPFWDRILRANAFVNNAGGSLVPFKIQGGSANDTSPATTTVNPGGRANASGTGYVNTQTPPPAAAGGLSVYLRDIQSFNPAATNVVIGARNSDNSQVFRIAANLDASGSAVGFVQGAWGGASTAQVAADTGAAMNVGHWHVQRNGPTSSKLRRNGTLVGGENTGNITAVPVTEPIYVFANNGGGTVGAFTKTPTSIGYYAILNGAMTDAQAAAYNTAVVAMMTAMGRNL